MTISLLFILFIILQRIAELMYSKKNERKLIEQGALVYDEKGYRYIVAMHVLFFVFLIMEYFFLQRTLSHYWPVILPVFISAQLLRYWALASLGVHWNTKVIVLPGSKRIRKGPYKYLNHPNYAAVAIEFAAIPLLLSCYLTAFIFSILNIYAMKRRVRTEENALKLNTI